jgi:hypothetical protein
MFARSRRWGDEARHQRAGRVPRECGTIASAVPPVADV